MSRRLLDLPNEILLNVIALVHNADLDNFTSTCKIIRNAAAEALHIHVVIGNVGIDPSLTGFLTLQEITRPGPIQPSCFVIF